MNKNRRLTHSLAGLGDRVHLVAFVAFTLIISFVVDADLAAGIRVLAFVDVWNPKRRREDRVTAERQKVTVKLHKRMLISPGSPSFEVQIDLHLMGLMWFSNMCPQATFQRHVHKL